jgi:hypothetical protein
VAARGPQRAEATRNANSVRYSGGSGAADVA